MGVLTSHISSEFFLPAKHKEAALKAIQSFIRKSESPTDYVYDADGVLAATTIEDALRAASLMTSLGPDGDVVELVWSADKLPFDTYSLASLLDSIARFVRANSYIELEEEFSVCRITFENRRAHHGYTRYDEYDGSLARAARALAAERPESAIRELKYAAEIRPEYCMAWVRLADVYAGLGRWDEAIEACTKAAEAPLKVYDGQSLTLDYSEQGYAAYVHNADYLVGSKAESQRKYEIAIPLLRRAALTLPNESNVFWSLASALYEVRSFAECLDAGLNTLRCEPRHSYGNYYSAQSLYHLGRSKEAIPYFARFTKIVPTWVYALCAYAEAARDAGDRKRLTRLCERVRTTSAKALARREDPWHHAFVAHALNLLGRWEEARREAEIAMSSGVEHEYIPNVLGVSIMMLGDADEAIPHFERAIRLDPRWEAPKYNLAQCLLKTGRREEAEPLFEAAVAVSKRLETRPDFA